MIVKRGDIFFAKIDFLLNGENEEGSAVLIIQNDISNRFSKTVMVAAISSEIQGGKLPTYVEFEELAQNSFILLDQVFTIDKARLIKQIGSIESKTIEKVNQAILIQNGIINI